MVELLSTLKSEDTQPLAWESCLLGCFYHKKIGFQYEKTFSLLNTDEQGTPFSVRGDVTESLEPTPVSYLREEFTSELSGFSETKIFLVWFSQFRKKLFR